MEHKLVHFKKRVIPHKERANLVRDWSVNVDVNSLNFTVLTIEAKALAMRYEKINVPALGHLEAD